MSPKIKCLTLLIAIFAVLLASTNLTSNNATKSPSLKDLVDLALTTLLSSPIISTLISCPIIGRHHHHDKRPGKKHPDKGKTTSICDDFHPQFPPVDTNTTSILCVDRNGCCNFTTVQAAVDAIPISTPPPSQIKRTIVWINSGLY